MVGADETTSIVLGKKYCEEAPVACHLPGVQAAVAAGWASPAVQLA